MKIQKKSLDAVEARGSEELIAFQNCRVNPLYIGSPEDGGNMYL
jgi:hypothetical protein